MTHLVNSTFVVSMAEIAARKGLPALLSYFHQKENVDADGISRAVRRLGEVCQANGVSLYLDSGVYTSRKSGETLELSGLIDFYHANSEYIDYVFTLDQGTYDEWVTNTRAMADARVPVIGILRLDMDYDTVKAIEEASCGYVAVASFGISLASKQGVEEFCSRYLGLCSILSPETKIHLLGIFKHSILRRLLPYSTDASSVARTVGFGRVVTFSHDKGCVVNTQSTGDSTQKQLSASYYLTRAEYSYQQLAKYQSYLSELKRQAMRTH